MTAHGFTNVDEQPDPRSWVDVLDRMRAEPAYRAYKARVAQQLRPVAGGRYLDVGCGTGADANALAVRHGVDVVGVDASETMVEEARRRGLPEAVVADAASLPFEDASFDGAWADRVFQHLADPEPALAELVRVTRPGGRIVVADPDYDEIRRMAASPEAQSELESIREAHGGKKVIVGVDTHKHIHVAVAMAVHSLTVAGEVSGVTLAGGLIM